MEEQKASHAWKMGPLCAGWGCEKKEEASSTLKKGSSFGWGCEKKEEASCILKKGSSFGWGCEEKEEASSVLKKGSSFGWGCEKKEEASSVLKKGSSFGWGCEEKREASSAFNMGPCSGWGQQVEEKNAASNMGYKKQKIGSWGICEGKNSVSVEEEKEASCGWASANVAGCSSMISSDSPKNTSGFVKAVKKSRKKSYAGLGATKEKIFILKDLGRAEFFMRHKWGDSVKIKEVPLTLQSTLEKNCVIDGENCDLVITKIEKKKVKGPHAVYSPDLVRGYYLSEGFHDIQSELDKLGNFAELSTGKAIARLELMVSPACWSTKGPYHFIFPKDKFKIIQENGNVGCGFVSKQILEDYFDGAPAVQIRIIGASIGWFKGVLVQKNDIQGFELPTSMLKVGPSLKKTANADVYVLCKNIFPSASCKIIGRKMNPFEKDPTEKQWKRLTEKDSTGMFDNFDIPSEVKESYKQEGPEHASLVGVTDPTNKIPKGMIFLASFGFAPKEIFITRSPNTDLQDCRILPVLAKRPTKMPKKDWDMLRMLPFGIVVFSNKKDKEGKTLPETIADGDLDGDLYQVCWNDQVVRSVKQSLGGKNSKEIKHLDDDLVGLEFIEKNNGKDQEFLIEKKIDTDTYRVRIGNDNVQDLSREEIERLIKDKEHVETIVSHRQNGNAVEVEVEWSNGHRSYMIVDQRFRKEQQINLVNYAIDNDLQSEKNWAWVKKFCRETRLVKVVSHRHKKGKKLEAELMYENGETEWDTIENIKKDPEELSFLKVYAKRKGLQRTKGFITICRDQRKGSWFNLVQNKASNIEQLYNSEKLIQRLGRVYKDFRKNHGVGDSTTKAFGSAWKQSIDIQKHGGKVKLPIHLRQHLSPNLFDYVDFTDENDSE